MKNFFAYILLIIIFIDCKNKQENGNMETVSDKPLLEVLPSSRTKIDFINNLKESEYMNGIFYEYFYNGSGVAVGDFNNDGWDDIYFVSTLEKNKLYLNNKDLTFKDVTGISNADSGFGFDAGVTTVDINQDGLLDIYICRTGRFQDENKRRNALMVNMGVKEDGVPVFKEMAAAYGLDDSSFSTQASFFDYDRDGDLDMFLINHGIDTYPDSQIEEFKKTTSEFRGERLYRNDNGKFNDVTNESGIINNMLGYGLGIAMGDLNNDGWPDIYVSHDFSGQDHLYLNQKNGTFLEVAKQTTGHISNFSMGNDIADYNNDGLMDIIVVDMMAEDNYGIKTSMSGMDPARFYRHVDAGLHHQYMYNTLQLNNGVDNKDGLPKFSDVAHLGGLTSTDWSWSPLFIDIDNNGFKDLFISNGIKRDFRNNDFIRYRKERENALKAGEIMKKEDFINDLLDKMPTRKKKNYFYLNNKDLTFKKLNIEQPETNSNGAAYADFDNDGDIDIVVNNSDDIAFIYKNNASEINNNNFLKVKFNGPENNRSGIGTKVELTKDDNLQVQVNYVTRGFQSSVTNQLNFGLGKTTKIDKVKITWNDGKSQILNNVDVNQLITVNYQEVKKISETKEEKKFLFSDITESIGLKVKHTENDFNDFKREELLPHRMSTLGPALAVGDVNGDDLDDFFIGGAKDSPGKLYVQQNDGSFNSSSISTFNEDKKYEDIGASFLDFDGDGDLDLYVSSGGNEYDHNTSDLQDRLYENVGKDNFVRTNNVLPKLQSSGSCVKVADFDNDGDTDIFVGGRQHPGKYPFPGDSHLLRNDSKNGKNIFTDVTSSNAEKLSNIGMVTDAVWADVDGDSQLDLTVVGEWMAPTIFKNENGNFKIQPNLKEETGWWYSIASDDFDLDGKIDFIMGNLGLNYKYKATKKEPFEIFAKDFDNNKSLDIVLGYYNSGELFPLRGRQCSSNQMPFVKEKFKTYEAFGSATLEEVYSPEALKNALHYQANNFATSFFMNSGNNTFKIKGLDNRAQLSSVNDILIEDFDADGIKDLILVGNLYGSEIETPRNDASYGLYLKGTKEGRFKVVPPNQSGLYIGGDVKAADVINLKSGKAILVVKNDDYIQVVKVNN
ncbi:FG-GAP-like repeat-containing protein [Aureibaculum sp. 2210JD6-5]|uniref:VCBS repeat-containing protein n=1 Tax=Aureibaculum sp. 2210JD6-5 TaxID=3103957 RepID=UPI002AADC5AE|nr:FG-GAP-like repeat-containing protein [Aureibaculum sp. 2210JD6-5]MDY7397022.1 FG-GAP-like repeat-containing protein [Aureibaculum sp. 2210JD6-5]